jgi:hypothetical protein
MKELSEDKSSKAITVQQLELQLNELGKLYQQIKNEPSQRTFRRLAQRGFNRIFNTNGI